MLAQVHRNLEWLLEWVVIILMVALTVVVIVGVCYRIAGNSLSWYDEVASVQLAWITYYGAALAALKRRHIGFDTVLDRQSTRLNSSHSCASRLPSSA